MADNRCGYVCIAGSVLWKSDFHTPTDDLELNLNVEVVDRILRAVANWNFHLNFWQYPYQLLKHYNDAHPEHPMAVWSATHIELIKPLYTQLADMDQKAVTAHIKLGVLGGPSMISWIRRRDGSWYYDYSGFDVYVHTLFSPGIKSRLIVFRPWAGIKMKFLFSTKLPELCKFWPPRLVVKSARNDGVIF